MTMRFKVTKATSHSADVPKILKIFGLDGRQVTEMTLKFTTDKLVELTVKCEVSEAELTALREEFEKSLPVQQDFTSLAYSPNC